MLKAILQLTYRKTKDIKYPVINFLQDVMSNIILKFIDIGHSFST